MSYFKLWLPVSISAAMLITSTGQTSGQEDLRNQAERMRLEAIRLAESGRESQAAAANFTSAQMTQKAEKLERERIQKTEAEIAELTEGLDLLESQLHAGVASEEDAKHVQREAQRIRREIEMKSNELRELRGARVRRVEPHPGRGAGDAGSRLEHMHRAIDHLRESGLNELAERVEERAAELERELEARDGHQVQQMMREMMERIESLSRQVEELRREVQARKK